MAVTEVKSSVVKLLYSVEEAAQALGLGRTFMYELVVKRKAIHSVKLGKHRLIPVDALQAFVDQLSQQ